MLDDLQLLQGRILSEVRGISHTRDPKTAKQMKIDPHGQRWNCRH